jgi:hypothetical protein
MLQRLRKALFKRLSTSLLRKVESGVPGLYEAVSCKAFSKGLFAEATLWGERPCLKETGWMTRFSSQKWNGISLASLGCFLLGFRPGEKEHFEVVHVRVPHSRRTAKVRFG